MAIVTRLWDDISEDNAPPFVPDVINEYWVGIFSDGRLAGCYRIHQVTSVCYQIHAFMIDRADKSSGMVVLKWAVENIEDMQKLIADIPACYPNVYHFTKKQGFSDEGINRQSFTKNGKIHDMHRLGVTREEIECHLHSQQSLLRA